MKKDPENEIRPRQHQNRQPGLESKITPKSEVEDSSYCGSLHLLDYIRQRRVPSLLLRDP